MIIDLHQKGFSVPLGSWIWEELIDEITTYFKPEKLKDIPCLDHQKMEMLIQKHLTGKVDYSMYIWRVSVISK